jgi:hypothetical protein
MDAKKLAAFAQGGQAGDEEEAGGEGEEVQEGMGRFGALLPLLEENAEAVQELMDEVDSEMLTDLGRELPPEDAQAVQDALDELDDALVDEMRRAFSSGLSPELAQELGDHLEAEGIAEDGQLFGGWLFRAAQVLAGPTDEADGADEEEEEEEEEEGQEGAY